MTTEHHSHVKEETHKVHHVRVDDADDSTPKKSKSLLFMIIALVIIIAIIGGILLVSKYAFPNKNKIEYNHYVFEKYEGNKWMTQQLIRGQIYNIPFYYNPEQVLDIPVDPKSITAIRSFRAYTNGTVFITVDPYESSKVVIADVEYARILGTAYNIYNMKVASAISQQANQTTDIPVITCKDSSKNVLVIYQKVSDKNLISVKGNCITLESSNATESIRVADAFAFRLLNIIKDEQASNDTLSN
jgi:hypothetical protein